MSMPTVSLRAVMALAIPAMATGVLGAAFRPVDQYVVQGLGVAAQGALGATTIVSILTFAMCQLVAAGTGPWVGRLTGANRPADRLAVIEQSLGACGALAVLFAIVGVVGTPALVGALGLEGDGAHHAVSYLRVLLVTGPALAFAPTVEASFHALGDTKLPLRLQLGAVLLNLVLSPVLVPWLGTAGAALGTTIAQTAATGVGVAVLMNRMQLSLWRCVPGSRVPGILRVGWPVALASGMFAVVYWLMMATTMRELGQDVYAGLGLGFGVMESVAWPMYSGLSIAVSSLVSRCLGAGAQQEAWRAFRLGVAPSLVLGTVFSAVYWFGGPSIMRTFAEDPAALREGMRYAALLAIAQPLVAMEALSEGVLAGAGDTKKVLWTNVPLNLIRVPLSWVLAVELGWGADGLWWAVNASTALKVVAKLGLVVEGGWMSKEL